ncbi:PREDICTED: UPF0481 protein At3g47200-like [Camelina sativa]|uniref:UPF0481 protein At3g47200-like n=1 Tax=Camelina sativa TaxID=90675 RepID=A0ABM0SRN7_CAMSA|nr:PREDICTED: UPF0481 protein At3g47200-like [Camelina sativa]
MGSEECCIYRVPSQLREVKPAAYTPRILLIGPLHHFAKPKVFRSDIEANNLMEDLKNGNSRYLEYLMMEDQKKKYMADFLKRFVVEEKMKEIIKESLDDICASYAVSTEWISSADFEELILLDSVFILELILKHWEKRKETAQPTKTTSVDPQTSTRHHDLTVDKPYFTTMAMVDLVLLENQLPYFILEKLFEYCKNNLVGSSPTPTLDELILKLFSLEVDMTCRDYKFKNLTDMYRHVYENSLGTNARGSKKPTEDMYNADRLSRSGVKFNKVGRENSLAISFNGGVLSMPCFPADDSSEVILRNVIAYEQCHDPRNAFTSEYIDLMNFLVTTVKDVEILTASGAISNDIGRPSLVVEMINKLGQGVLTPIDTIYHDTTKELNIHCNSCRNNSCAILKKVYCSDLWTGTATAVAAVLLLLTIAATVASIYQAVKTK